MTEEGLSSGEAYCFILRASKSGDCIEVGPILPFNVGIVQAQMRLVNQGSGAQRMTGRSE